MNHLEAALKKLITLLLFYISPLCFAQNIHVLASIQPIHSLTAQVMQGVGEPELLLPPGSSPHFFQLRPSDAKAIQNADLIIWVGPELENFLEKPFENLNPKAQRLALTQIESIQLLPFEYGHHHEDHKKHDHDHDHDHDHHHHHGDLDPHIWLSPEYAKLITDAIAEKLKSLYPEHAKTFNDNAQKTKDNIDNLTLNIKSGLLGLEQKPFLVFHDGYQYFTRFFQLNSKGPITRNPHVPLGPRTYQEIKTRIREEHIQCVFGEPDTNPKVLNAIIEDTPAKTGILDPLGMDAKPSPEAYSQMMYKMAISLQQCLSDGIKQEAQEP